MRASIASILLNLELPGSFRRKSLYRMRLEKNGAQVRRLNDERIRESVGTARHDGFLNNPCFHIYKEIVVTGDTLSTLSDEMLSLRGMVQHVLLSLWLVKDNAITSDFSISKSDDDHISFNQTMFMFSDSEGEYKSVSFSDNELKEGFKWFDILLPNITFEDVNIENPTKDNMGSFFINSNKNYPYQSSNRLQRAIRFIAIARADSFPPAKITFYISALEALLSISNAELRMQVADRSARILGDSFEDMVRINKIVSIAYSFRSSYIHGAVNSEKTLMKTLRPYGSVEELTSELDEVLRQLLKRFLTDLNYIAQMNDEDFSLWIIDLLYK